MGRKIVCAAGVFVLAVLFAGGCADGWERCEAEEGEISPRLGRLKENYEVEGEKQSFEVKWRYRGEGLELSRERVDVYDERRSGMDEFGADGFGGF
ncbi:hypothetical protein STSP2_00380 [Anaerohalosphaera lusitana]|uniref:Lipoprotein n=1 Tax=Anaerohalosphaera lusitana TaxID=1936003 RepID=A0A1U9NHI7_9BACT|nr:hypothetical protein [Anaerohalosphaera lusitana]AQT67237.1 hypothetical protein STSP2_00380 [Anaerohalosphaera lusitana]